MTKFTGEKSGQNYARYDADYEGEDGGVLNIVNGEDGVSVCVYPEDMDDCLYGSRTLLDPETAVNAGRMLIKAAQQAMLMRGCSISKF